MCCCTAVADRALKEGKGSDDFRLFAGLGWLWMCAQTWLGLTMLGCDWSVRLDQAFRPQVSRPFFLLEDGVWG